MKELVTFFGRRYSAVSTNDNSNTTGTIKKSKHKSLQSKPSLTRGFSIVDSFFHQREAGKRARWPKCVFLLLAAGLCLISTSIFIYIFQPYDLIFKWKLLLSDGGEIFNLWKTPPVNLYIKIYLFNITNHKEFLAGKEKMNVQEVGPYVYREVLSHENITFNDNGTLSTIPKHPLVYQPEMSEGRSEDDVFWLPNIALLSIAQVTAPKSYFLRLPINLVIRQTNSQPIVNMTAKEFMFGYESPLTTLGNRLLPSWIYFEKVGLIDRMYDFNGDYETFFTGETDIQLSGLYDTFKGSTNLPHWETDHCSKVQGASDGTKFKSFINETEKLLFFRKSMCRPIKMVRTDSETSRVQGLEAYRYKFEENALDNGNYDERNKCFCRDGRCLPDGLLDVTDCYYGFPIALSFPHFKNSHPDLIKNISGSTPNSTHDSYFLVNPVSGLPLKLSVKFQINMAMRDVRNMAHVEKFSHLTIPMLWFEIAMNDLPQSLTNRFILYLNILPVVENIFLYGCMPLGIVLAVIAVTRAALRLSNNMESSQKNKRYNHNLANNVYNSCEEKLIHNNEMKFLESHRANDQNYYQIDDDDNNHDNLENLIIRGDEYELENDVALSDIEYSEENDYEEFNDVDSDRELKTTANRNSQNISKNYSFSNASTASASRTSKNSSTFIDIELSNGSTSQTSLSSTSLHNLEFNSSKNSNHSSLLQIVESDNDNDSDDLDIFTNRRPEIARKFSLETERITKSYKEARGHRLSLGKQQMMNFHENQVLNRRQLIRIRRGKIFFKATTSSSTTSTIISNLNNTISETISNMENSTTTTIASEISITTTPNATTATIANTFNEKGFKNIASKDRQSAVEWILQSKSGNKAQKTDSYKFEYEERHNGIPLWEIILIVLTIVIILYLLSFCLKRIKHWWQIERLGNQSSIKRRSASDSVIHKSWCWSS